MGAGPINGFTVSGAGSASTNGNYDHNGSFNSKPKYTMGTFYIAYLGDFWIIAGTAGTYYYVASTADYPPLVGWVKSSSAPGVDPPPTLSSY